MGDEGSIHIKIRISRTLNQPLKNISITEDGGGAGYLLKCFKCILQY